MRTRLSVACRISYTLQARSRNTAKPTSMAMAAVMMCVSTAMDSAARARPTPSLGSIFCSNVAMLSWNSRERNLPISV